MAETEPKVEFFSVSLVPAPRCESCLTQMEPASATEWVCLNQDCSECEKPVHVGIYPAFPYGKPLC